MIVGLDMFACVGLRVRACTWRWGMLVGVACAHGVGHVGGGKHYARDIIKKTRIQLWTNPSMIYSVNARTIVFYGMYMLRREFVSRNKLK